MTPAISYFRIAPLAVFLLAATLIVLGVRPARADRCEDIARQLAEQIAGLRVGKTVAGVIYLDHPAVKQASLGCSSKNRSNEVFAATDKRKPSTEFYDFVGTAAALVFTIPKKDALNGATRCIKRTNIIRGYDITSRYRRLDIACSVAKSGVRITVSREKGV